MKRTLAFATVLSLGMISSTALAAPLGSYKWTDESRIGADYVAPPKAAVSNVIYLNNCKPNGCAMKPGYDNATTNTSSIPDVSSTIAAFTGSDTVWNQVVQCVRQTYADFDIQIVTERPASGNYHMAIVAGTPSQVQQSNGVLGVSPFSCGYIPNAVSYTFANVRPNDVAELCWTVAQETAHSWGLDHKYDNRDPMTYLSGGPSIKSFQDEAGSCGEYSARQCTCNYNNTGSSKMNSFAVIMGTFGPNTPDVTAPKVTISYPTEMAQVTPNFPIRSEISDDRVITKAEFRLDGTLIKTLEDGPYNFNAPATLAPGKHKVEVTAYDRAGNTSKGVVNVAFGSVCTQNSECTGEHQVCLDGRCVAGPGSDGGLGSTCDSNADCSSQQCANDGSNGYCVEGCDPTASACPGGFSCEETAPGAGVCWPESGEGGGCSTNGDSSGGMLLLALGFVGILVTRKKR
jgi:hypothetical protein